jgi:hypothetical protein
MTPRALVRARRAVVGVAAFGVLLMLVKDAWYTLLPGVVLMLGAVAAATFLVAQPDGFLDHDAPDDDAGAGDALADDATGGPPADDGGSTRAAPAAGGHPGGRREGRS